MLARTDFGLAFLRMNGSMVGGAEIIYRIGCPLCPIKNWPAGIHPPAFSAMLVMQSRL